MTRDWIALLITAAGGIAIGYAVWRLRYALKSAGWPWVTGYVLRSAYAHDNYPAQIDSYRIGIVYEYTVEGVRYTNNQIAIGRSHFLPRHSAKNMVQRYRPGAEVKVYYDPARPAIAVLNPGQFGYALFNLVAALIVVTVAISAVWRAV